ncbi:MAG: diguanylate cyclase [Thiotrichales bacterium]
MKVFILDYDPSIQLQAQLGKSGIEDSEQLLIQLFTTSAKPPFTHGLLLELQILFPNAIVTGCTTTGLLRANEIVEDATRIVFCAFDRRRLAHAEFHPAVNEKSDWYEAGNRLGAQVGGADTRLLLCYATGPLLNAEALARGLLTPCPNAVLAGQLACAAQGEVPRIISGRTSWPNGVVVIALTGNDLHIQAHHSPDWMMLGTPLEVTDASDNVIRSVNKMRATELYSRYIGFDACKDVPACSVRFPFLTQRDGMTLARPAKSVLADGAVSLWGDLHTGDTVRFGILNPADATDHTQHLLQTLRERPCELLFQFSSIARTVLMRSLTQEQFQQYSAIAPTLGAFSVGQFYYTANEPALLHYTQTVLCIGEGSRAKPQLDRDRERVSFSQDTLEMRAMSHLVFTTAKELEDANKTLERLANTDSLTRVFNRHKAQLLLDQEYRRAQRYARPLTLILFDVDDFKRVNDTLGHSTGDEALARLAEIVRPLIRDTDYFARWGGEEFLIICPETEIRGASEIAERVRIAIETSTIVDGQQITISLGVASFRAEDTLEKIINRADRALYISKEKGKNRVSSSE